MGVPWFQPWKVCHINIISLGQLSLTTTSLEAVLMRGQGRKSGFYDVLN